MSGLSGHMMHPIDNPDLRISDLISMIRGLAENKFHVTEKMDGFGLQFILLDGEFRLVRSKTDLHNFGIKLEDIPMRFSHNPIAAKYYSDALTILNSIPDHMNPFEDFYYTRATYNAEIIEPGITNVMYYGTIVPRVYVHNKWIWSEDGSSYQVEQLNGSEALAISQLSGLEIPSSVRFELDRMDAMYIENLCYTTDLMFGDYETIRDYVMPRFKYILKDRYRIPDNDVSSLAVVLFSRIFLQPETRNLREIKSMFPDYVVIIDRILKDATQIRKDSLKQIRKFVDMVATSLLGCATGFFNEGCVSETIRIVKDHLEIGSLTPQQTAEMRLLIENCNSKVLPLEGIVLYASDGNMYKFTGPFAYINKVVGYENKKRNL